MEVMRLGGAVPVLLCIVLIGGGIAKDVTHEEDGEAGFLLGWGVCNVSV